MKLNEIRDKAGASQQGVSPVEPSKRGDVPPASKEADWTARPEEALWAKFANRPPEGHAAREVGGGAHTLAVQVNGRWMPFADGGNLLPQGGGYQSK